MADKKELFENIDWKLHERLDELTFHNKWETGRYSDFRGYKPFLSISFKEKLALQDKDFTNMVDKYNYFSITPSRFEPQAYHLYHGTSTQALDRILESRTLRTGANLHRSGQLVWGEMKEALDKDGGVYDPKGPKYLHPTIFEKLGIELTEKDRQIFGHAFAVFFASHPSGCLGYAPKYPEQQAILGVNRNALEMRGYTFVDCKGEGIKCESNIDLEFGLQVLLVPDCRVDEYRQKVEGAYCASVYPLSDLKKTTAY